jgi:hypothetical protein
MAKRQVVLLGLALALITSARAQQQSQSQSSLGELFSGDASVRGSVLVRAEATQVMSGSQIAAGDGMALLKLRRGGQVRICPRTKLSLSADAAGKVLSLGLDAGAMELQYQLESGADSLLTPDFRLQLISPGVFHLAISVSASGDTCLQSLPGADAAVFVTEMMGDESYQLSPGKKVLFRKGKIADAGEAAEPCGCPETKPAPMAVAQSIVPSATPPITDLPKAEAAFATAPQLPAPPPAPQPPPAEEAKSEGSPSTPEAENPDAHLEVQSQFEYRGDQAEQDFYTAAARLSVSTDNSKLALALLPEVAPWAEASKPLAPAPPPSGGGFLHRMGAAFRHLFGGH